MLRLFISALAVGLLPGALMATEPNDRPPPRDERRSGEVSSQSSQRNLSTSVTDQCDIRRPSCRRWRALANDRLNGERGGD